METRHGLTVIAPKSEKSLSHGHRKKVRWIKFERTFRLARRIWNWKYYLVQDYFRFLRIKAQFRMSNKEDIVIVNGFGSIEYASNFLQSFNSIKVLICRESPRHFDESDRANLNRSLIKSMKLFDRYIFVSNKLRIEWCDKIGIERRNTFYLPNCCEEEVAIQLEKVGRQQVRMKLNLEKSKFIIVCPGSIEKRKGQDIVINHLKEILAIGANIELMFIGDPSTSYGLDLKNEIDNINCPRITTLGSSDSILEYIYCADLLLFPSRAEALPRTILEAMALNTPIVSSNVDGIPELIEHTKEGLLFNHDNPGKMVSQIRKVYEDKDYTRELVSFASDKYWREFARDNHKKRTKEIIENLV